MVASRGKRRSAEPTSDRGASQAAGRCANDAQRIAAGILRSAHKVAIVVAEPWLRVIIEPDRIAAVVVIV